MRRVILPFVACLAVPHISTLSHTRHDFQEEVTHHAACRVLGLVTCSGPVNGLESLLRGRPTWLMFHN